MARVMETAKAINISSDQRLLLVEAQEFVIDGHEVREPIGMSGIRLKPRSIVTGAQSAAENIIKCAAAAWKSSSCCSTRWRRPRPC
jgi:cell division protein FtsA